MRILPIVLIVLLCLGGLTAARLPAVGDHVRIQTSSGMVVNEFYGNVTDITTNMICLNCSEVIQDDGAYLQRSEKQYIPHPFDLCIGSGSIFSLTWIGDDP